MANEKHIHLAGLINRVCETNKEIYPPVMVKKIIKDFMQAFIDALMDEYPVQIKGLGTFRHHVHQGRILHTWGRPAYYPDRMRIRFTTEKELGERLTKKYIKEQAWEEEEEND